MANNFILSLNTVLPIVILTGVGMLLGKLKLFSDAFYSGADKFVFKVALPCMLFLQVAGANFTESAGYLKLMLAIVGILILLTVFYCLIMPLFIKDKRKLGATVQGMFRSNVAILGLVLIENMFPEGDVRATAVTAYAMVMPFVVLMYNVFSVGILAIFMPSDDDAEGGSKFGLKDFGRAALETLKNPLIIGVVLGFPFSLLNIQLPAILNTSIKYLSNCTTGLALVSLGAGFSFKSLSGNLKLATFVTAVKTVIQPAIGIFVLYLLGFRGPELAVAFVIFGTPVAVSSYIMAKNMKSDYELAGQILLLTTIICIFTLFAGSLLMRTIGLI